MTHYTKWPTWFDEIARNCRNSKFATEISLHIEAWLTEICRRQFWIHVRAQNRFYFDLNLAENCLGGLRKSEAMVAYFPDKYMYYSASVL